MFPERQIVLALGVRAAMVAHAERALPAEAVGMLCGKDDYVSLLIELINLGGSRHFIVDPRSQYEAERRARAAGLSVLAIYHSHPGGGAAMSDLDISFASRLPMLQFILAIASPHRAEHELRAYSVLDGRVDEVQITG